MSVGEEISLRLGRYQDVMQDVECDLCCFDAPYSERTHGAYSPRTDVLTACERDARWATRGGVRRQITYDTWSPEDVAECVDFMAPRTRGWFVTLTDHILAPHYEAALERHGRYVFSPLSYVAPGSRVRLVGDGPSQWACLIVVARPRRLPFSKWGTLPGAYVLPEKSEPLLVVGGKPLWLMRELIKDYSRPGDTVADCCAGGATTLLAAALEGRRAIGAEMDPETFEKAQLRIAHGNSALRSPNQTRMEF